MKHTKARQIGSERGYEGGGGGEEKFQSIF